MDRRNFLFSFAVAAVLPSQCSPGGGDTMTLEGITDKLRASCNFITAWEPIAQIVATLVSGFNPAVGAATAVAMPVAMQVIDLICHAVRQQVVSQPQTQMGMAPGHPVTVVVNGVEVKGTYKP